MKKIIALVLLAALALCLVACGGGFSEGEYSCDIAGITFSTMKFEDGSVYSEYRSGKTKKGTYSVSGSKISVSWEDGASDTFEYDSDSQSFSISEDETLVWKKVS